MDTVVVFDPAPGPGGGAPETIVFSASEWVDTSADLATLESEFVIACRVTRKAAASVTTWIASSGNGAGDTYVSIDGANDRHGVKLESDTGTSLLASAGTSNEWETDETNSIVVACKSGSLNVYFNSNTPVASDIDAFATVKAMLYLNSSDNAGADAAAMEWIGGVWISAQAGAGDLTYNDFFDGAGLPTFGTGSVGGVAADVALTTVAQFNAYGGMNGTAT